MAKGTEVAKKEESSELALPDWMKGEQNTGVMGIDQEDVALPRISLLQALSPQVSDGSGRPGEYYHLLSEDNLGKSFRIIPVLVTKSYLLWRPRNAGGGLLARADDGVHWSPAEAEFTFELDGKRITWRTAKTVKESRLDNWGSFDPSNPQSLPAATKLLNVLCYLPDFPHLSPSIMSLQRALLKPGRKFVGRLQMSQAPTYGMVFNVGSEKVVSPKGEFMSPTFISDGFVQDKALFDRLKEMNEHFRTVGVKVAEKGLDEEADQSGESGPGDKTEF